MTAPTRCDDCIVKPMQPTAINHCHCEEGRSPDVAISRYNTRNAVQERTLYQEIATSPLRGSSQ